MFRLPAVMVALPLTNTEAAEMLTLPVPALMPEPSGRLSSIVELVAPCTAA